MKTLTDRHLQALQAIFPGGMLTPGDDRLAPYGSDEGPHPAALPAAVVLPTEEKQVAELLRYCAGEGIPVTPRGSGTGLCGGAIPINGGVVVALERMKTITAIDAGNFSAVTQPGVILKTLHDAVEAQNLFYPPDPNSLADCSVGGTVATAAGGPRCVKYGVTRQYLQGVRAVLPDGSLITYGGRYDKIATGYNLAHLLCGSEGTLGVVTEITLRLIPRPAHTLDLLVPFAQFAVAASALPELLGAGFNPALVEFMDAAAVGYGERFLGKPQQYSGAAEAQLILQLDGNDGEALAAQSEKLGEFLLARGALDVFIADNRADQDRLWELRRSLTDAIKQVGQSAFSEDVVVPRARIADLLIAVRKLKNEFPVDIATFGHVGDGNVHVYCVKNELPEPQWQALKPAYCDRLFALTRALGGTISGEHGIGLTKRPYLRHALGDREISLMRALKQAVDPRGIMNPGKIF